MVDPDGDPEVRHLPPVEVLCPRPGSTGLTYGPVYCVPLRVCNDQFLLALAFASSTNRLKIMSNCL